MYNQADIWNEVSNWPPEQQLAFATRLFAILTAGKRSLAVSKDRREALQQLIGIWRTDTPPER
jgi:hypothetical protein